MWIKKKWNQFVDWLGDLVLGIFIITAILPAILKVDR